MSDVNEEPLSDEELDLADDEPEAADDHSTDEGKGKSAKPVVVRL